VIAVLAGAISTLFGKSLQVHDPSFPYPQVVFVVVGIGIAAAWGLGPALSLVCVGAFVLSPLVLHSSLLGLRIGPPLTLGGIVGAFAGGLIGTLICVITTMAVKRRTEVIATRAELARSAARTRALLEQSSDLTVVLDVAGHVLYASPSTARILGYAPEGLGDQDVFTLLHPDDLARLRGHWERVVQHAGQRGELVQVRFRHADGSWRVLETITNNRLDDPHVHGIIVNGLDVSERVQAQEELRASEQRFRALVQESPVGMMIVNAAGICESVNPALCAISGYDTDELIGRPSTMTVPPAPGFAEHVAQGTSVEYEYEVPAKGGRLLTLLSAGIPLTDVAGQPKHAFFIVDITDRKRAEQEQTRATEAMAAVSAALGSTLALSDLYGLILQQTAKVLPLDHAQILALDEGWLSVVAHYGEPSLPSGTRLFPIPAALPPWMRIQQGRPALIPDTADEPAWRDVPPRVGPNRLRSIISIPLMVAGELFGVFEIASATPNTYGDRHIQIATVFGDRITQALRNARLFEAEQQRARAAEELARLRSDFVSSVSHELRTPLTTIIGIAELLQHHWLQLPEGRKQQLLDRLAAAARRQNQLVEDLLLLSRLETGQPALQLRPVLLAPLVEQAARELGERFVGQHVNLDGAADLEAVADPAHFLRIVTHLLDNAAKYSPEGTPIFVSWAAEAATAVVRVRDHGPGVTEEMRQRLFTRFERVAGSPMRAGRIGTGLGLYLSRQLARAMAGDLDLEGTGPDGSTFRLRLPIHPAARATPTST
jgi:PAS domain S-box-containing protein